MKTLNAFPGKSRLRVRIKRIQRPETVGGQSSAGSMERSYRPAILPRGSCRRGRQGLVCIDAVDFALNAARAAGCAEVATVFGFGTRSTGPAKSSGHFAEREVEWN